MPTAAAAPAPAPHRTLYRTPPQVKHLLRFLVDCPLSGGAWLAVPPADGGGAWGGSAAAASEAAPASSPSGSGAAQGWSPLPPGERLSSCDVEASAPWSAVCCLSPDATQMAEPGWSPWGPAGAPADPALAAAAAAAARGDIPPLRMAALDVVSATRDGTDRAAVPAGGDPIVAVSLTLFTFAARGHQGGGGGGSGGGGGKSDGGEAGPSAAPAAAPVGEPEDGGSELGEGEGGGGEGEEDEGSAPMLVAAAAPVGGAGPPWRPHQRWAGAAAGAPAADRETLVFLLHPAAAAQRPELQERGGAGPGGAPARVLLCRSEAELLLTWATCLRAADPDVLGLFQVS